MFITLSCARPNVDLIAKKREVDLEVPFANKRIILGNCQRMACIAEAASSTDHCLALFALLALAVFQRIRCHEVLMHVIDT